MRRGPERGLGLLRDRLLPVVALRLREGWALRQLGVE